MTLGIDIGGTNVAYGIVDEQGKIIYQYALKTKNYHDPTHLFIHIGTDIMEKNLASTITAIGIGAPSIHPKTGIMLQSANINWRPNINIRKVAHEIFNMPAHVDNDANAAAYGEWVYGVGKGSNDLLVLTLGTGVGSGIIADGRMIYGSNGLAGELGHVNVIENGRPCGCGRRGCLETYVASKGIVMTYQEMYNTSLQILPYDIYVRARNGDEKAIATFRITGEILGKAIANFVNFSNPEKVILLGGILAAHDYMLPYVRAAFEANVLYLYRNTPIITSMFNKNEAPILGAAAITRIKH